MTESFYHRLEKELSRRRRDNLHRELKLVHDCRLNLSTNDYFHLRRHAKVLEGARRAMDQYGAGTGASPLLSGYQPCHESLVQQLLSWKRKASGMLFNSGFVANQAVLQHLPGKNDLILADKLIHHSIAQTLTQGPARFKRYRHLNLNHLEEMLCENHRTCETVFVVTESVFSMDGDTPDLKELVALKKKYPFVLILDEAHGTGVYGPRGEGLAAEQGVSDQVDILVGTLGKALASMGAYVLAQSPAVIDTLINTAGEFIYSTYLAPAQVGAAAAAIEIIQECGDKRRHLRRLSTRFREELAGGGWETNRYDSPIIPILLGDAESALQLRDYFLERGIFVGAIRPPTVPKGTSRLRISLHSELAWDQIEEILEILKRWKNR